jgi:hypothetical protein
MTPAEMAVEGRRLSNLLDAALGFLKEQIPVAAEAEQNYRKAKAEAWLRCPNDDAGVKAGEREWTAARREAWCNAQTADLRYLRDVADGMVRTGYQAVRSRQAQMSLLQSEMNAFKAEANFAAYGPDAA